MKGDARADALAVLTACRRKGLWLDAALRAQLKNTDRRQAALCSWLCYTVAQNRRYLDFLIAKQSRLPLHKIQPQVLDCLRLGLCQLWASNSIPPSAAVNETVKAIRASAGARAAGFANALLRAFANTEVWPEPPRQPPEQYHSIRYNLPVWMVERFQSLLGGQTEDFFASVNRQPPLTLQFNPAKTNGAALRKELEAQGLEPQDHPLWPHCLQVENAAGLDGWPCWTSGAVWVADVAAALAVQAAGAGPGMRVLDACAAPGGKTLLLASAMEGRGHITACDIHDHKLEALRHTVERAGETCVEVCRQDALSFQPQWAQRFDLVFCDLPCSGLGVMAKKPDIRDKTAEQAAALPDIQKSMLANLGRYTKPGGRLLYATCTLLPEENEDVARHFTRQNPDFQPKTQEAGQDWQTTLWPHLHNTDGFYFALWEKSL